jgi:hypothetical protein
MTSSEKLARRANGATRVPKTLVDVTKTGIKRKVKSAATAVSRWGTAKKIGVAAAAAAVPVVAAAIATAIMKNRGKAARAKVADKPAKDARKPAKARRI